MVPVYRKVERQVSDNQVEKVSLFEQSVSVRKLREGFEKKNKS